MKILTINKKAVTNSSSISITQKQLTKTLKGTTIVESIIAMTIIAISFSIGLMVVEMVLNSSKAAFLYRVRNAVQQQVLMTKNNQNYLDITINQLDFIIEQKIAPYQDYPQLFELKLVAKELDDDAILEHKELIYVPE